MINAEEHLPMVSAIASNIYRNLAFRYNYEDLFQIGCIGLIKAINKFDESKGFKFSTYAYKTIWGEIKRSIRDEKWHMAKRDRSRGGDKTIKSYTPISLDMPVGSEKNISLVDIMSDNTDWQSGAEVRIAVNKLPQDLKELIIKKFFLDYKTTELTKEFAISQSAVSRRIKKALSLLREELTA